MNAALLALGHLWAIPMTLAGALTCGGAKPVRSIGPAWTFVAGPFWQFFFRRSNMAAITLGAFVFCEDETIARHPVIEAHEKRHVFQQMILGPLFPVLYYGAMPLLLLVGKNPYRANPFEVDARRASGDFS